MPARHGVSIPARIHSRQHSGGQREIANPICFRRHCDGSPSRRSRSLASDALRVLVLMFFPPLTLGLVTLLFK
jgi:hypothetical protein